MRIITLALLALLTMATGALARPEALELWLVAERAELPKLIAGEFSSWTADTVRVIGSVVSDDPNKVVFYVAYLGEKTAWREVICFALEEGGYLCNSTPYPPPLQFGASPRVVGQ